MNVQTALNLIDGQVANLNGTRADHIKMQEAIAILQDLIDKSVNKPKDISPPK